MTDLAWETLSSGPTRPKPGRGPLRGASRPSAIAGCLGDLDLSHATGPGHVGGPLDRRRHLTGPPPNPQAQSKWLDPSRQRRAVRADAGVMFGVTGVGLAVDSGRGPAPTIAAAT